MSAPAPMLAADFDTHEAKFPVLAQPKLDGFRCLARREANGWVLYSRGGKVIALSHITDELHGLHPAAAVGTVFDGELYAHGMTFQRLASAIRSYSTNTPFVHFHIFDLPGPIDAQTRLAVVRSLPSGAAVRPVEHQVVWAQHLLERLYEDTLAAGYEGLILRDPTAAYTPGRTWAMQKLKPHHDAEFLVIGHRTAPKREHLTVLTCRNDLSSGTFDVLFPHLLDDPAAALDHMLTVRFSGRTDSLLPRFPVAMRLRDEVDLEPAQVSWAGGG